MFDGRHARAIRIFASLLNNGRNQDFKCRSPAGKAHKIDGPSTIFDYPLNHRKPHATANKLGAEERVENLRSYLLWYAAAAIRDFQSHEATLTGVRPTVGS